MVELNCIQCVKNVTDWQEGIEIVGKPMVEFKMVEQRYVEAMKRTVQEMGAYIVIAPNIALPHASPEEGVIKTGMSILKLAEPVFFEENEEASAKLLIAIACSDGETHMKMLQTLVTVLMDEEKLNSILEATNAEDIYQQFQNITLDN